MPAISKKAQYRQRVYQLPDGSIQLVFGSDAPPVDGKLLADHDIVDIVTVTDHVEPTPIS
jgi:hypothetical protein